MEHAAYNVDVLDQSGAIVGSKPRRKINKQTDIHHTVFVFLITPKGEIVLGVIPAREDLPNIYSRLMGVPVATMRRTGETAHHAAQRGVQRELFIENARLHLLGECMLELPENIRIYATAYYMVSNAPDMYSLIDIDTLVVVTPQQIRDLLSNHPNELSPTFIQLWESYSHKLPI